MIPHSVHTLKEGTIEGNTAIARLRLVHRDETHLALLGTSDEVFAELALAAQRLCKCYENRGEIAQLRCKAEKMWINITFERHRRKGSVHLQRHFVRDRKQPERRGLGCEPFHCSSHSG